MISGSTLNLTSISNSGSLTLVADNHVQSLGSITNTGRLLLSPGIQPGTATITSLAIAGSGSVDLANNTLVVNYGANSSPIGSLSAWIRSGQHGGTWNGTGLTSSFVAANRVKYNVGYADGADGVVNGLAPGQALVQPALTGDVNLDGSVNQADQSQIAGRGHFKDGTTNNNWIDGDVNHDGIVDIADIRAITLSGNYSQGAGPRSAASIAPAVLRYIYDDKTGDIKIDAPGIAAIGDLHLISAAGSFIVGNSTFSGFVTKTPNELENALLGSSFADGYDLGQVLPPGMDLAAVQADLTLFYGISGSGVETAWFCSDAGVAGQLPERIACSKALIANSKSCRE